MKHKLPAFDVLVDLARNDPERLERLRKRLTADIIDNASDEQRRKRLAGLQFRVDMERERARSPLQATIRISEMMCQSLAELHRSMVTPFEKEAQPQAASPPPQAGSGKKGTKGKTGNTSPQTLAEAGTETAAILPFPGQTGHPVDTERS